MNLNIQQVPFSAPSTYLCISDIVHSVWGGRAAHEGLYLRTARAGHHSKGGMLARIQPLCNGAATEFTYAASVGEVRLKAPCGGGIRISMDRSGQVRFKGDGLGMELAFEPHVFDEFLSYADDAWYIAAFSYESKLMIRRLAGRCAIRDSGIEAASEPKYITMSGEEWELSIGEFTKVYRPAASWDTFAECAAHTAEGFEAYAAKAVNGVPARYIEAARQAAYVNYTSQVGPEGLLKGSVMLMSKNWMNSVWTWDCQFNAVETAPYDPNAAWDNFASPFNRQDETGMLLDMISDHAWSDTYTKPPVHGWALSQLRKAGVLTPERRVWAYEHLLKMVNSWYNYMDWDHDGVCQYNHGNDSGWDNCTYFLCGAPIEGPELSAYLALCWNELAELAEEMGRCAEAEEHRRRAQRQIDDLIKHSWDGERFHVYQSGTHNEKTDCDSLLPFLPIILGDLLPEAVFHKLADGLKQEERFLTPFGLATERVNDKYYISDGYWRGPIWAPAMMFIIYGLAKGGETDFASDLAESFCANCAREGFAENFDATSGAGLRDRAYTWTSSVFLILAKNYVRAQRADGADMLP